MVETFEQRFHGRADFRVIVKPAARGIDLALHGNLDFETMPVHSPALVAFRRIRQRLGRFEIKIFCQSDAHSPKVCHPERSASEVEGSRGTSSDVRRGPSTPLGMTTFSSVTPLFASASR